MHKHRQAYVRPASLEGKVKPPASKSLQHRRLFCHYLACLDGDEKAKTAFCKLVEDLREHKELASEDILATCDVLTALLEGKNRLECRESGSTLRFAIPVAALSGSKKTFSGKGRLPERPLAEYKTILQDHGVKLGFADEERETYLPLSLRGKLQGGSFSLAGNISSQYLTGLLLALPCVAEDSLITLETPLESASYVELTLAEQKLFGVHCTFEPELGPYGSYVIKGRQKYRLPSRLTAVEADASQAAFFHLANFLGADIDVRGLRTTTSQGDAVFRHLLGDLCAMQNKPNAHYMVQECDVSQFPDIVPAFALACAIMPGTHILRNAERLRMKECDRLRATVEMLDALGVDAEEGLDFLLVRGLKAPLGGCRLQENGERQAIWFKSGDVKSYNDHRMMMCLSIAACFTESGLLIDDIDCVKKSYPGFWDDFVRLGGVVEEVVESV